MHTRLPRQTRRQAPGITEPLLRHRGRGIYHADTAAVSPGRLGIAGIARIVDADLVRPGALNVAEAAAEDGVGAVASLLDGESWEGFAFLAVRARLCVGGEGAGRLAGAGAELDVGHVTIDGGGGLDADFGFGAFGKLGKAAEGWSLG